MATKSALPHAGKAPPQEFRKLIEGAEEAAGFLKAMAHELRLLSICYIGEGERSVQELEEFLGTSQSNVSQHLGKMRDKGILVCRKAGNQCFYRIKDPTTLKLVRTLHECFCS